MLIRDHSASCNISTFQLFDVLSIVKSHRIIRIISFIYFIDLDLMLNNIFSLYANFYWRLKKISIKVLNFLKIIFKFKIGAKLLEKSIFFFLMDIFPEKFCCWKILLEKSTRRVPDLIFLKFLKFLKIILNFPDFCKSEFRNKEFWFWKFIC